jgi:DNA-binding transcriptional MocR family regulator
MPQLTPALRTGWLLVPAGHHDAIVAAKREADLGNAAGDHEGDESACPVPS